MQISAANDLFARIAGALEKLAEIEATALATLSNALSEPEKPEEPAS